MKRCFRLVAIAVVLLSVQAQELSKIEVGSIWRNKFLNWDVARLSGLDVTMFEGQRFNIFKVVGVEKGQVKVVWGDDKIPTTWLYEAEFLQNFQPFPNEIKTPLR